MLLVLISFIAFIALFVLGLRWGVVIIGKVLGRVVYDRHRNAEYIINTGQVPDQWTEPYFKKIDEARKKEGVDETERERRIASLDRKAKRNSIKRIDDLLRYFSRAPVFADDHSRRVLMEQLESAKAQWLKYVQ